MVEYTELTPETRLGAVRARKRDLEMQHMQLSLRVNSPDLNQPLNESDVQNLRMLEESLSTLSAMEQGLTAQIQGGGTPAAA